MNFRPTTVGIVYSAIIDRRNSLQPNRRPSESFTARDAVAIHHVQGPRRKVARQGNRVGAAATATDIVERRELGSTDDRRAAKFRAHRFGIKLLKDNVARHEPVPGRRRAQRIAA